MIDFLRTIFPLLYVLIPFLLGISLVYWGVKSVLPEHKSLIKTICRITSLAALVIFAFAVIRMAAVNNIPENELDNSVKKERSNYAIDKSKQDTITIK